MPRRARAAGGGITEAAFQRMIVALATFYGWRWYHAPENRPTVALNRDERRVLRAALGTRRVAGDAAIAGRLMRRLLGRAAGVQTVQAGFPDLVLVRGPELIFAEIKTDRGAVRDGQVDWLADLEAVGDAVRLSVLEAGQRVEVPSVDAYLWRPRDWPVIEQRLARGRRIVPASFDPRL